MQMVVCDSHYTLNFHHSPMDDHHAKASIVFTRPDTSIDDFDVLLEASTFGLALWLPRCLTRPVHLPKAVFLKGD
jgi:hypothetical protein